MGTYAFVYLSCMKVFSVSVRRSADFELSEWNEPERLLSANWPSSLRVFSG